MEVYSVILRCLQCLRSIDLSYKLERTIVLYTFAGLPNIGQLMRCELSLFVAVTAKVVRFCQLLLHKHALPY